MDFSKCFSIADAYTIKLSLSNPSYNFRRANSVVCHINLACLLGPVVVARLDGPALMADLAHPGLLYFRSHLFGPSLAPALIVLADGCKRFIRPFSSQSALLQNPVIIDRMGRGDEDLGAPSSSFNRLCALRRRLQSRRPSYVLVERFQSSKSSGMPETAAFRGWKAQDAIEWFHGIDQRAMRVVTLWIWIAEFGIMPRGRPHSRHRCATS